jgi:hypothetical protein
MKSSIKDDVLYERYKLNVVDYGDLCSIYEEKSRTGWHLSDITKKGNVFTKGEPKEYTYQADFTLHTEKDNKDEEVYLEKFKDAGWELAAKFRSFGGTWYYIRKIKTDNQRESIFIDDSSKLEYYKRIRQSTKTFLLFELCTSSLLFLTNVINIINVATHNKIFTGLPYAIIILSSIGLVVLLGVCFMVWSRYFKATILVKTLEEKMNHSN